MAIALHKAKTVGNSNLHMSRAGKTDEFYTPIALIENELRHYRDFFRGKIVFCNCDDPYESNFFKYFAMKFNFLGLKKLIVTCFAGSPITNTQLSLFDYESMGNKTTKSPHKIEIEEITDENADGAVDLADIEYLLRNKKNTLTRLAGDGDFRSIECLKLLKEADVVVTNPPFSLFREYIAQLMEHGGHFLIISNQNAITYREILPLFINNKIWLGYNSGHFWFQVPDTYEVKKTDFKIDEAGVKWRRMGNICWFTNIDIEKRHDNMTLFRNYSPEKYPKYDGYDAIEVSRTADIPCDYFGVMGVPITFIDKHNPEQFELLGDTRYHDGQDLSDDINVINGKTLYRRLLIRRRNTLND
jgi:hypothetical protein